MQLGTFQGEPSKSSRLRMSRLNQSSKPSRASSRTSISQQMSNWGGWLTPTTRWYTCSGEIGTALCAVASIRGQSWMVMRSSPGFGYICRRLTKYVFLSYCFYALIDCIRTVVIAGKSAARDATRCFLTIMSSSNILNDMWVESRIWCGALPSVLQSSSTLRSIEIPVNP